jgi:hypothetical protein
MPITEVERAFLHDLLGGEQFAALWTEAFEMRFELWKDRETQLKAIKANPSSQEKCFEKWHEKIENFYDRLKSLEKLHNQGAFVSKCRRMTNSAILQVAVKIYLDRIDNLYWSVREDENLELGLFSSLLCFCCNSAIWILSMEPSSISKWINCRDLVAAVSKIAQNPNDGLARRVISESYTALVNTIVSAIDPALNVAEQFIHVVDEYFVTRRQLDQDSSVDTSLMRFEQDRADHRKHVADTMRRCEEERQQAIALGRQINNPDVRVFIAFLNHQGASDFNELRRQWATAKEALIRAEFNSEEQTQALSVDSAEAVTVTKETNDTKEGSLDSEIAVAEKREGLPAPTWTINYQEMSLNKIGAVFGNSKGWAQGIRESGETVGGCRKIIVDDGRTWVLKAWLVTAPPQNPNANS